MSRSAGAEEEAMAVITIQGPTKRFGEVLAIDDLSFEVDQGTVVGFLVAGRSNHADRP
jgi:ABC-type uncharacterized transport system ATPase subunit